MHDTLTTLEALRSGPYSPSQLHNISARQKTRLLSASLHQPLDRVAVLGEDHTGHTGCVNALSWVKDGEFLVSGGDDTTIRLWRLDSSDTSREYPFVCNGVVRTGHRGNIFNAQLLPHSARITTVARDGQGGISDVGDCFRQPASSKETLYTTRSTSLRILRCHKDAVKRIVTEDSPDLFLTVSEDGTVRQHDLRAHHTCVDGSCPTPLVEMNHELSTLALSPLTPYQFVVAGSSEHGYLFDRRQSKKHLRAAWGMSPDEGSLTTCVRRFGRPLRPAGHSASFPHITGARMASTNGHEVLLSYSADAVYLYSTMDDVHDISMAKSPHSVLPSNPSTETDYGEGSSRTTGSSISNTLMEQDIERFLEAERGEGDEAMNSEELQGLLGDNTSMPDLEETYDEEGSADEGGDDEVSFAHVPVVHPRARYAGACNVETVKDVNFLGPQDEYVVSGSDDGHWFMWNKNSHRLHDILEGDSCVVNVIEGHPSLPLVAVSGIDTTVKIFAPHHGVRRFSRMHMAERITQRNAEPAAAAFGPLSVRMAIGSSDGCNPQ
ncbi:WD40-repeat-containing domain protein [Cytidiella melzeri]|nr:WD40-repeat-containing domain protein [Cytidiella melzeri]